MNISEAKEYIKNSIRIYLKKDEYGDYKIPVVRQRPIFLLGAPGIGKTAIMEQIAGELGIALVSYSMTHHTRQSALGLPFIKEKEYGGKTVSVSEYTMSEIISSIYETMEESGVKEGVLFLDEINCVSETLAPSMLQFLQYKVFGRHQVPEGWVIVTAGNPPEYNRSVREFDVVTMDRLKVLSVEADYPAWKAYAIEKGLHGAILNFLDVKKEYFYHMETTPEGRSYVTARGWEDLSDIITLYEEDKLKVNENLISQYLSNDTIVREFAAYYDLYNKYKQDYRTDDLLNGKIGDSMLEKAGKAGLDERLSLMGILLNTINDEMKHILEQADALKEILPALKKVKDSEDIETGLRTQIEARKTILATKSAAGSLTPQEKKRHRGIQMLLEEMLVALGEKNSAEDITDTNKNSEKLGTYYNDKVKALKEATNVVSNRLHHLFVFTEKAFGSESNEMLVLVTELTVGNTSARFISTFGSADYAKFNALLMVTDRKDALKEDIEKLVL
ncbi:MAG: AAA family ATPase [Lachnospiraceae bacterium]|nr:AAA family ATPase [Lachnospiraceae bacterium]